MLLGSICLLTLGACSNDDLLLDLEQEIKTEHHAKHTVKMTFVGNVVGFDQSQNKVDVSTRASTNTSWNDGDQIYITFFNDSIIIAGLATYQSSAGWSVSYDGELAIGKELKCEARYFVNTTQSTQYVVTLNANSEIYEDLNATYAYNDGALTVQASLVPKTGRIRFTGKEDTNIYLTGITRYSSFTPTNNTFYTVKTLILTTVADDGSTPYIYGYFTDEDKRIGLIGEDYAFTRLCTAEMLKTGESGYMAIPSESAHNNWRSGLYVDVNGVEFRMIPVAGHSGGFFLIGETEVTEELYGRLWNSVSTNTSQLPVSGITYGSMKSFISHINNTKKLSFSLPSESQWNYAAKGGNKSIGYTYSGSNTLNDVAWYPGNTSSKQRVKTKAPNELGIYDK